MDMQPPPGVGSTFETYHRGRKLRVALAAAAGLFLLARSLRRRAFRVEVAGPSMEPALMPGDWAIAVRTRRIRRGDVVVLEHPGRPGFEVVKRVVGVPGDLAPDGSRLGPAAWWVQGDAPARSTDSRDFGPVRSEQLRGRIRLVYWPPARLRILRNPLLGTPSG
jgi:signal peptidase I